ncbi:hypothetical protein C5167_048708 [Papaver somniferum]|uniref:Nucleoplasmin-like domain-containing protein n=1 Tax=Papaver somniferum TaxID=3469 RepID=A0A4Y7KK31_PAPSO|nr:hypothetical protein C5167_048708 [Papaver somniferum]
MIVEFWAKKRSNSGGPKKSFYWGQRLKALTAWLFTYKEPFFGMVNTGQQRDVDRLAALVSWGHVWALSTHWCAVQVKVGSKNPFFICKFVRNSLRESISLDLEFDEGEDEIVFELLSTGCKVHLTGYYDGNGDNGGHQGATEKKKVKEETDTFYRWPQ